MPGIGTSARPRFGGRSRSAGPRKAGQRAARPVVLPIGGTGAARVGHDLHTPVAIILGLCARLEASGLDAPQLADIARVRAQAAAIAVSADSLLTPAAAAAGRSPDVDAAVVVRDIVGELSVLARACGAQLIADAPVAAPLCDPEGRLSAAITNLVTNALRQVGAQGIVRCSVTRQGGDVCIEVADSGAGLTPSERDDVLLPFTQGSGARGKAGLGLSIVRDAAATLGATLDVGTADEGGASFRITVPADVTRARPRAQSS